MFDNVSEALKTGITEKNNIMLNTEERLAIGKVTLMLFDTV